MDYFNDILPWLGIEWGSRVVVLSMEGQKALHIYQFAFLNWTKVLWVWNDMRVSN